VPIIQAIVLGITQGLSEFLPISSSGHLILVRWLFGWDELQPESVAKAFDVALHLGTLIAVVAYFWRDLVVYVREGVLLVVNRRRPTTTEGRLAWLLVLSAVPAGIVGASSTSTSARRSSSPSRSSCSAWCSAGPTVCPVSGPPRATALPTHLPWVRRRCWR
jgi:undecaprenyl-diphosphatase